MDTMQTLKREVAQLREVKESPAKASSLIVSLPITGLSNEDNVILARKYKSPPFISMELAERLAITEVLLLKISVITGWQLPGEPMLTILVDQLAKKLVEAYPTVNPDEFEYAFRTYGPTIKDWGRQCNLGLIDQAISPYLAARWEVSDRESQKQIPMSPVTESLSDQAMVEWLDDVRTRVRAGGYAVDFIPVMLYDWLDKTGKILTTGAEKREYLARAVDYRLGQFTRAVEEMSTEANRRQLAEFAAMRRAGEITGEHIEPLKVLAKKMILFDMLQPLKAVNTGDEKTAPYPEIAEMVAEEPEKAARTQVAPPIAGPLAGGV